MVQIRQDGLTGDVASMKPRMMNFYRKFISTLLPGIMLLLMFSTTSVYADKPGLNTVWVKVDGHVRRYLIYKPTGIKKSKKERSLVFVMHGAGSTDQGMVNLSKKRWNQLAELHKFYVVYPNAMELAWDFSEGPTSENRRVRVNDLNYLTAVMDDVFLNHYIDASRVFATGHARGGMAAYFMGCHLNGKIRAIAPVSMPLPTFLQDNCVKGLPLGIALFNGTSDPIIPYYGGWSMIFGVKQEELISTDETIQLFRRRNGCSPIATQNQRFDKPGDKTVVQKHLWAKCLGADVALYRIENGGHTWPSGQQYLSDKLIGHTSQDINAADEAWQFFNSFKSNPLIIYSYPEELTVNFKAGLNEQVLLKEFPDRPYDIFIPENLDSETKVPVLLVLHDQDVDAINALKMTCNNGRKNDPSCITELANREGFVVIFPRGTPRLLTPWKRSWNAGGGDVNKQWQCSFGRPCEQQIDDIGYLLKTLEHVQTKVMIDFHKIYVAGLGNGAAMSHRLACQIPDRISAIVAIAGTNQASAVQGCLTKRPVPILQIHGTADCAWPFVGGISSCGRKKPATGDLVSFADSMQTWARLNGCDERATETIMAADPSITRLDWQGCQQPVKAWRIDNGGHFWPDGFQPKVFAQKQAKNAIMNRSIGNQEIWDFLSQHSLPKN